MLLLLIHTEYIVNNAENTYKQVQLKAVISALNQQKKKKNDIFGHVEQAKCELKLKPVT